MNKIKYLAAALIAIAGFGLQQAKATTTYTLGSGNSALSGYPAPYGTVTVNLVGNTATITFTAANTGAFQYLFGDGSTVAMNVNGPFTFGSVTGTHLPGFGFHSGEGYSNGGAGSADGFGIFNLTINSSDGYTRSSNSVTVTITGSWANDASVLTANSDGFTVAAHIYVAAYPADAQAGALATGFASNGGGRVPDGGTTVMLLGVALGALGMVRRYLAS
jgi:VPDSG-CTERM motif